MRIQNGSPVAAEQACILPRQLDWEREIWQLNLKHANAARFASAYFLLPAGLYLDLTRGTVGQTLTATSCMTCRVLQDVALELLLTVSWLGIHR